jgi:hypothetical protein
VTPAVVLGHVQAWLVAAGILFLIVVTIEMRRYRRRLKAKRRDGSEAEQEQAGP